MFTICSYSRLRNAGRFVKYLSPAAHAPAICAREVKAAVGTKFRRQPKIAKSKTQPLAKMPNQRSTLRPSGASLMRASGAASNSHMA